MDELLTAKQVQDLLQVDRTTVYRMLKDGRLTGVKVGQLWRFSRQEVEVMLAGLRPAVLQEEKKESLLSTDILPLHCVQAIQDVFAEVAQVGSITAAPTGQPLSKISNSCSFCSLILGSQTGREGCVSSWRRLANQTERRPRFDTCHAGLQYARARIEVDGALIALLIAGQFYAAPPDLVEEGQRIDRLAEAFGLNRQALAAAARDLPVIDDKRRLQIGGWLEKVAGMFSEVGRERAELMNRLRRIAAISILEQG